MGEDRLRVEPHGGEWVIQRHILREGGVVLAGPPPAALIDPVTPDDLKAAVRDLFQAWWAPMLDDQSLLRESGYRAYAVLTMGRTLYTLRYGAVVSKPAAARWARQTLGERWVRLIEWAQAWPAGAPSGPAPGPVGSSAAAGDLAEALHAGAGRAGLGRVRLPRT
jgi:hypothetical protein